MAIKLVSISNSQLRWFAKWLPKRHLKWYAALEQSGMSASNFLYSILVVRLTSVADLGVYSFWFVVCQFVAMLTMGLATRQMVLNYAHRPYAQQAYGFAATRHIIVAIQVVIAIPILLLTMQTGGDKGGSLTLVVALAVYCLCYNLADLYREFEYMRSRQRFSLIYSGLALGSAFFLFLIAGISGHLPQAHLQAFWFLAAGHGGYVLLAQTNRGRNARNTVSTPADVKSVFGSYFNKGIVATSGMLVTWMQNQSATPLLMFMLGPVLVGYYSLARMIVTPVNMVANGLAKSALPHIRRAWGEGDHDRLTAAIRGHRETTMRIVYGYIFLVALVWLGAHVFNWKQPAHDLVMMFLATVVVMVLSNYRFWISQNFVVRQEFGILLRLGIASSVLTVSFMLVAGMVLKNAVLVVCAPALGELLLIVVLSRLQKSLGDKSNVTETSESP